MDRKKVHRRKLLQLVFLRFSDEGRTDLEGMFRQEDAENEVFADVYMGWQ